MHVELVHPSARIPARATPQSAGLDLTAPDGALIVPGQVTLVDTGVKVELPAGTVGLLCLRSSLARRGLALANGVGVIDADYRGEIGVMLRAEWGAVRIDPGERIAQLVVVHYYLGEPIQVYGMSQTARGEGGFGSTGR